MAQNEPHLPIRDKTKIRFVFLKKDKASMHSGFVFFKFMIQYSINRQLCYQQQLESH
jgi:hypothetical protein